MKIEVKKLPQIFNICRQILREIWKSNAISIAHVTMRAGSISIFHKHTTFTELYYILSGRGIIWLNDKKFQIGPNTLIEIKPNVSHKLKNVGRTKLTHLVVSNPPFNSRDIILSDEK